MLHNERYVKLALKVAKGSQSKFRLGAVVVKKNKVLSVGFNRMRKTHPIQQKFNDGNFLIGIHAEVHACLGVDEEDLFKATIYVGRLTKTNKVSLAKPCPSCVRFLSTVSVTRAFYTTDNNTIGVMELL